jgi:hypothetical protein
MLIWRQHVVEQDGTLLILISKIHGTKMKSKTKDCGRKLSQQHRMQFSGLTHASLPRLENNRKGRISALKTVISCERM